jgi:iron-sulfur cluster assembly protein
MVEIDKNLPVKFTLTAEKEIKRLSKLETPDKLLHIGVKNGGCSGLSYIFEFKEPIPGASVYQMDEVNIAIDSLDLQHIENLEIDYEQGLNNRGFTFTNPNANTTCGCGTSFA